MLERNIDQKLVEDVLSRPDEVIDNKEKDRKIAQKIFTKDGKKFLYRVIFSKEDPNENLVITVYRTTKIDKYYRRKKQ